MWIWIFNDVFYCQSKVQTVKIVDDLSWISFYWRRTLFKNADCLLVWGGRGVNCSCVIVSILSSITTWQLMRQLIMCCKSGPWFMSYLCVSCSRKDSVFLISLHVGLFHIFCACTILVCSSINLYSAHMFFKWIL